MSVAELTEEVSAAQYQKFRAIEALDFEAAQLLHTEIVRRISERTELQFREIQSDAESELGQLELEYDVSIQEVESSLDRERAALKVAFDPMFDGIRVEQRRELADAEEAYRQWLAQPERVKQQASQMVRPASRRRTGTSTGQIDYRHRASGLQRRGFSSGSGQRVGHLSIRGRRSWSGSKARRMSSSALMTRSFLRSRPGIT
jgi:hypothetical protein